MEKGRVFVLRVLSQLYTNKSVLTQRQNSQEVIRIVGSPGRA